MTRYYLVRISENIKYAKNSAWMVLFNHSSQK